MNAMRGVCGPSCLDAQERLTLAVHVRGVVYISRWLLLTNLVLVAWIVAMMGGRLRTSAHREQPTDSPDERTTSGSRAADLRLVLAAGLVGSAAIHAAVVPEHLTEWSAAGLFFVGLTAAELAVAGLLLAGPPRRSVLVSAALVSIGPLLIWLASRTAGLPFGPEPGVPEAIGLPDVLACALEIVTPRRGCSAASRFGTVGIATAVDRARQGPRPGGADRGDRDRDHRNRADRARRLRALGRARGDGHVALIAAERLGPMNTSAADAASRLMGNDHDR